MAAMACGLLQINFQVAALQRQKAVAKIKVKLLGGNARKNTENKRK